MVRVRCKNGWVRCLLVFFICILSYCSICMFQMCRYDVVSYNCRHMSIDCANFFRGLGFPTQIVHGDSRDGSSSHCWVRLWGWLDFESTCLLPVFNFNEHRYVVYRVEKVN